MFTCRLSGQQLPGVPIFLPYYKDKPSWRGWFAQVLGYARGLANLKTGTYGECAVIWGDPNEPCFRVQDDHHGIGLHLNESPHGQPDSPGTDIFYGVRTWYTAMGMNAALHANFSGDGYKQIVRQSLADVANMPGVKQIVIDPECISNHDELVVKPSSLYSTAEKRKKDSLFHPSIVACDCEVVSMWGTTFTLDDG